MVARQLCGSSCQRKDSNWRSFLNVASDMPGLGRKLEEEIDSELQRVCSHCSTSGIVKDGSLRVVEKQARKKQKGALSANEARLIKKYLQEAQCLEEELDEEALGVLINSSNFKKFVQRTNLEDEVVVLHQQLQQEVELHTSLERALAHASGALPNSAPRDLPVSAQKLLLDIASLEATVLELETQTTALQWELVHERTEREVIEHCLNPPLDATWRPSTSEIIPASPSRTESQTPLSPKTPLQEIRAPSDQKLVTLKELLRTPCPHSMEETEQRSPLPKSPQQILKSIWSSSQNSLLHSWPSSKRKTLMLPLRIMSPKLNTKRDKVCSSPKQRVRTTCFPSPLKSHVPPSTLPRISSPHALEDLPRPTSPATPRMKSGEVPLKDMPKSLPSAKRLAFWNLAMDKDESPQKDCILTNSESVHEPHEPPSAWLEVDRSLDESQISNKCTESEMMQAQRAHRLRLDSPLSSSERSSSSSSNSSSSSIGSLAGVQECLLRSPPRIIVEDPESMCGGEERGMGANQLSEEMVRRMVDIYCHLSEPNGNTHTKIGCPLSPSSHFSHNTSSGSLSCHSETSSNSPDTTQHSVQEVDQQLKGGIVGCGLGQDPYKVKGKLQWADIGPYSTALEVPWLSVRKGQLVYVAQTLGQFRVLVEQLSKLNLLAMTHEQKLAFWINLYNAILMHAFLAYGVPRSELKLFSLMQKAAYCVGGQWFNAAVIEHCLLQGTLTAHRPQFALMMALNNHKLSNEQIKFGIDQIEPKVNFALSCGAHSSPMVRVYTADHIHEQLNDALQDYVRAAVGVSAKGKVVIPKLVYNYAREIIGYGTMLDWLSEILPAIQVAVLENCIQERQRHLPSARNFKIVPFNFTYRYLFFAGDPLAKCRLGA